MKVEQIELFGKKQLELEYDIETHVLRFRDILISTSNNLPTFQKLHT